MRKSNHDMIRQQLAQARDGATATDIANATGLTPEGASRALKAMPDTYVDRWTRARRNGRLQAVWAAVAVPEDCPKP